MTMHNFLVTLMALTGLLCVCAGLEVANSMPNTATDAGALSTAMAAIPVGASPSGTVNATVAGNNVLISRSNIIVIDANAKRGIVNLIKNLVMKGSSPQDDDALTTQIISVLGGGNSTISSSDMTAKMMPKIKTALKSRNKPVQLRQIIVKLTEMSPKFNAPDAADHNA